VAILRRWEAECSSFLVDVVVAVLVTAKVLLNSSQWVGEYIINGGGLIVR
jgi:hypothetical protein